jgi:hypothetical protein
MQRGKFFLLLLFILSSFQTFCQEEDGDTGYFSEFTVGINFNTNANIIGGVIGKYTREIKKGQYHFIGLELLNVKNPKEQRVASSSTGNLYIFQKKNNLFPLRLQYGREFVLFHPAEEEGVQVNFTLAGGPTIGIVKPYMVEYDYGNYSQIEAFDPDKNRTILGSGGILSGLDKSKIVPGLNVKASFSFEFSQFRGSVTGIEVGGLLEAYTSRIELVAIQSVITPQPYNAIAFSSIFVNIFFGFRK